MKGDKKIIDEAAKALYNKLRPNSGTKPKPEFIAMVARKHAVYKKLETDVSFMEYLDSRYHLKKN